jgi:DNA-binding transcriptional MerR regulator
MEVGQVEDKDTIGLKLMTISQFSELVGVSVKTLRNWDKKGYINPIKLPSGQRRYTKEMIHDVISFGKHKEEKKHEE